MMSGVTPKVCAAKGWPVRPKPVMTSSKIVQVALGRDQHAR
jgi:hypothetical protein